MITSGQRPASLLVAAALLGLSSCVVAPATRQEAQESFAPAHDAVADLRALGYLGYSPEPAAAGNAGVSVLDPARTAPGYSLYVDHGACEAVLLAPDGSPRRRWSHSPCGWWSHARLARDGALLVIGAPSSPGGEADLEVDPRQLLRFDWSGTLEWQRDLPVHHDVAENHDGTLTALTRRTRRVVRAGAVVDVADDLVQTLTADGRPLREVSLYGACAFNDVGFTLADLEPTQLRAGRPIDLLHANSVQLFEAPPVAAGPLYAPGNLLVSSRHQDSVLVLEGATGRLVWAWGRGELSGPHDATLLPSGNILVFDNGLARGWSRALELDPRTGRIVWQYRADPPRSFFTASRGSAQRLINGDTLVASSDTGEAFEVTPGGEVVWRFLNPRLGPGGRRAAIVRMQRYDPRLIEGFGP